MNHSENPRMIGSEPESNPAELLERIRQVVVHRRWWFLTTASVVILGSLGVLARTPNRYTSEATIIVTQQRVPERYVTPTSTTDLIKDLETMQGEVLSRTRLSALMSEFNLYAKQRKRAAPEQVFALMLRDINVEPLVATNERTARSFKVSFTTEDPVIAREVTSRLASLFILNNVKGREDQAVNTTRFLKEQLEVTQKRLAELEERLRDFKMQHLGELPEQQQGNLAILGGLQTQLQNTTASIARAEQQRVYLESLLTTLRATASQKTRRSPEVQTAPKEPAPSDEAMLGAELRLAHLQNEKKTLVGLRGPDDPDVRNLNVEIARTDALLQRLRAAKPQPQKTEELEPEDTSIAQIKSQLQANQVEKENLTRDEKQLKESVAQYQGRLNQAPVREQQLAGLLRDIELARHEYADLLTKEQESQLATSLEQQQGGQQFRLLEPPSLPTLPSSPKRVQLGLGAGGAGLVVGLLVAFLMDFKYRSFYTEKEVSRYFSVPLVVGVPLLLTPTEKRRRTWRATCEWISGTALTLIVCAAEVVYLQGWRIFV